MSVIGKYVFNLDFLIHLYIYIYACVSFRTSQIAV